MKATLVLLLASGCAGSFEEARTKPSTPPPGEPSVYCQALDRRQARWHAISLGTSSLAGAGGIASIPVEDRTARAILLGIAVAAGAVGIAGLEFGNAAATSWARDCSGGTR